MPNKRIFYAVQAAAIGPEGATTVGTAAGTYKVLHGAQSFGLNTNFNLEQVFELGQLAIYENIENIPDIEVSVSKLLDGYCPAYILATEGSSAADLAGRSTKKCQILFSVFNDDQKFASGIPVDSVLMSGMFPQQVSYSFPADGNFTESVTFVGNHKVWYSSASNSPLKNTIFGPAEDSTLAADPSGGVNRREDIIFILPTGALQNSNDANGMVNDERVSTLPRQIPGINSSGNNLKTGSDYNCHLQTIEVSTNLGRDELFELGRKAPYHRFVTFPTEVTCSITVTSTAGDGISATEQGGQNGAATGSNLLNESIRIRTREGLFLDLGVKNKIQSITYGGGDATGGNRTTTYNFSNFNDLVVKHLQDPTTALRPTDLQAYQLANQ